MKYEKPVMFVVGVAAQFWQLFVIMTVWNWFASAYHVFTFGQIICMQMFVQGLSMTQSRIIRFANKDVNVKELAEDFAESVASGIAMSTFFGGVLLVACIVHYFQ